LGTNLSSLTDTQVAAYADNYFQYDSSQRVTQEVAQGAGDSQTSGGLGTYSFSYTTSANAAGYDSWHTKTVVTNPDGSTDTVYTNTYGQVMLDDHYDPSSALHTDNFYAYNTNGQVTLAAEPSAVAGYNDSYADLLDNVNGSYQYLNNSSGLITRYDYYTTTTATETAAGGVVNYLQDQKIQQGQTGTLIPQETWQYYAHAYNGQTIAPIASDTVYRNTDGTGAETTSYSYTWYSNSAQIQSETDTAPVISAAENGPGGTAADVTTTYFDQYGNAQWTKEDPDGYIQYDAYDPVTGALLTDIVDVNTADSSEFTNLPSGWSTPTGGGLNLVAQYQVDALGRTTKETSPAGNITYYVYLDAQHEERIYQGWNSSTGTATLPTEVIRADSSGTYTEYLTMTATPHLTNGAPDGSEAIGSLVSLTRDYVNAAGQLTSEDAYNNLSGLTYSTSPMGTLNTNYYQSNYGYDSAGRLVRTQTGNGTIYRTVYNSLDEAISAWVGTNDTPTSGEWSPTNNTGSANMVEVSSYQYDNGGVGDGNLTQETDYPGLGAPNRVTDYWYDWRDRQVAMKSGVQSSESDGTNRPILVTTYDNLDEVTETQQYLGDGVTPQIVNGVLQPLSSSLLRAQEIDSYDDQGRLYRTQVYDVNPSTGTVSTTALTTNYYYDHRGNLIAEADPGGLWTKSSYDGAGRDVMDSSTDGAGGTSWSAASSVANDTVLEQVQTVYDAEGNPIETIDRQRFHNATGTGALGSPSSGIGARVYYAAEYYDNADRVIADVNAGTSGGSAWTRPGSVPASSATLLVTTYAYTYYAAGLYVETHDPMGIDTHTNYDNLGRLARVIQNYTGQAETTESDVSTNYYYDGNNNVTYVVANQPGGAYQQTRYVYGVTTASSSGVNSNDILSAIQHPDPSTGRASSSQQDKYLTNALGDVVQSTDRNGNVHQYSYDVLGRLTSDAVTTLGTGVDGTIRRITYGYDSQGNLSLISSYNAASGGSIVNQVQRAFNGLGQLAGEYQSHSGAVNTSSTPEVQYAYTEMSGGQNNSRLTSMTYPSGYVLNFNYNSGLDSNISRLSSISDSGGTLESYKYLGLDTVVERDHPQNNVNLSYIQQPGDNQANTDGGDQYTGLDRFGRVIDQNWINATTATSTDRFQYGYNQDSDVLYRQNLVDAAMSELYTYDNLSQLTSFQRGTLNSTKTGISGTASRSQSWSPDALGNFTSVTTNGTAQTRTANQQNEYTSISGSGTITYDANGNLTADGSGNSFVYDAWNRLVAVQNNGTTVASYTYDGLGRRITQTEGGTATDLYHSSANQVLEEDVGGVTQARNVWSPVYVNAMVLRDQSSQHNGTLDQRLYVQQDANWNVTALVNTSGSVVERYEYDPYGAVTVLSPTWSVESGSSYNVPYGFQGMRYDWTVGLNFADHRVYSPTLMRWLQTDPLGLGPDDNEYRMEGNGPTDNLDPSGLDRLEYGRPDPTMGGRQAVYYIRRGYTIFGNFDQSPVFIGYYDPDTNEVYRKGYSVALATLESEVNAWFYTTGDWDGFFRDKGNVVTNDGNDPRRVGWMAMQERAGTSVSRNERAAVNEKYVKPLVKTAVANNFCPPGIRAPLYRPRMATGAVRFVNCFPVDTSISTKDGLKPIQDVRASDLVWAFDLIANEWKLRRVIETFQHEHEGNIVTVSAAGEEIESTGHHPWWVVRGDALGERPQPEHVPGNPADFRGEGRWVDAIDLQVGDILLLRSGEQVPITRLAIRLAHETVYNFHVEELHCYAVGKGQVLVHNNSNPLEDAIGRGMKVLRGKGAPDDMVKVLEKLGRPMDRIKIGDIIHKVKQKMNIGAAEDLIFDLSGGMWDPRTGEYIGKIWEPI